MSLDRRTRPAGSTLRLVRLDRVAHGIALMTCVTGGILLESVVLMAVAVHHVASIGFSRMIEEGPDKQHRSRSSDAMSSVRQLVLWTCCLMMAIYVTATGAHGVFHPELLNAAAIAGFVAPGAVAAATTGVLACWSAHASRGVGRADALLSAMPTVAALCIASAEPGIGTANLDALAGLALVLLLCVRTVLCLRRALD